ncbi:MAG: PLP-dependent aminotransferase family protein [Alphaproteobacteria bacterium]
MTIQDIDLAERPGPKYRAIADALAAQIADGSLAAGAQLPTHRELAWKLGVTVGTVSRAYAEIARRGLLSGEIGRGSYVRTGPRVEDLPSGAVTKPGIINLSHNFPSPGAERAALARTLAEMAANPDTAALLDYQPEAGLAAHRMAGAAWIGRQGWAVDPARIVITAGGQHAILTVFASLTRPGDRIVTEALSYQGIKPAITQLGLRAEGLAMDENGLIPKAFERAARSGGVRALYCMPTLHNPTTATLPEDRRRDIAAIALRHGIAIVEDDIYGPFHGGPPLTPLTAFAGELGYYLTSLSKTVAPGLRTGYVLAPADRVENVSTAVRASCWMAPPLMAEIATRWITDGTAERVLESHKTAAAERQAIAARILPGAVYLSPPGSLHLWLDLPEPWRAGDFVAAMRDQGVAIAAAETFAIGRASAPHAVRVCLGTPHRIADLETGLTRIAAALGNPTAPAMMQV